jgi:hypothetical protein
MIQELKICVLLSQFNGKSTGEKINVLKDWSIPSFKALKNINVFDFK